MMFKNLKKIALFAGIVTAMFSCTQESDLTAPTLAADNSAAPATTVINTEVPNFTISGVYTEVVSDVDCATCTFVVAPGTAQVDGKALGIKPGAVICLQTGAKYPSMEFVNLEGTANSPITVGYCNE